MGLWLNLGNFQPFFLWVIFSPTFFLFWCPMRQMLNLLSKFHMSQRLFIYLFFSSLFSVCYANFCCSFFECINSSLCSLWSVVEFIHWIFSLLLYFSGLKSGSSLYLLVQCWDSLLSYLVSSVLHWSNFLLASGTSFSENSTICVVLVLASVDHLS